ncbi:hypothetical protein COOONC_02940 [Cooperia oncophora]
MKLKGIIEDLEYDINRADQLVSKKKIVSKGLTFNNFNNKDDVNTILKRMEEHLKNIAENTKSDENATPAWSSRPNKDSGCYRKKR